MTNTKIASKTISFDAISVFTKSEDYFFLVAFFATFTVSCSVVLGRFVAADFFTNSPVTALLVTFLAAAFLAPVLEAFLATLTVSVTVVLGLLFAADFFTNLPETALLVAFLALDFLDDFAMS